jgi:AbrB family looped-hinge helix DNA binding protein
MGSTNKAAAEVTLSQRNSIVIPAEARKALGLRAADKILLVVQGSKVLLPKKPKSYPSQLRGPARGAYPPNYLRTERDSW